MMIFKLKNITYIISSLCFLLVQNLCSQNLALNKPVTVQSTHQNYVSENAVDGVVSDVSRWLNTPTSETWMSVDLENIVRVGGVHIYTGYGEGSPISDFKIQYDSNGLWQDVPSAIIVNNTSLAVSINFDDTVAINTDAIRLLVTNTPGGYARIREITIWEYSPDGIPDLGEGVTGYVKQINDEDIPRIYINQSGYNLYKPKRFTVPTLDNGTEFTILNKNTQEILYTGTIVNNIGDFSDFNPTEQAEYEIKAGDITSFSFGIGLWWAERVTYQNAIDFMIDSRHYVGNYTGIASKSYAWRDESHFGWELHALVPQYLSHPEAYNRMPSQISYIVPTNSSLWGALDSYDESAPDIVKLIHWGADVYVTQGLTHENIKTQLAYFLYAWPYIKQWLPRQNYDVVKAFVFQNWTKTTANKSYTHDESPEHNLLALKTIIGTTKGGLPPGRNIQPNLLMYEVAKRNGRPDAESYFDAAYNQAEWMISNLDWEDPMTTKGQRMSEFHTITGLSHFVVNYPNRCPSGLKEKIEEWASVMIRRSNNMWDFRKFTNDEEWIPFDESAATKWNEPGNVVGFPASLFAATEVIENIEINNRLVELAYAHIDNCFGRNPVGRHFSYDGANEIEGVDVGWFSFYKGGIGQLGNARFVLDGAPKYNHYPYNPEIGNVGWTEGWVQHNVAYNLSLAYMAHYDIDLEATVSNSTLNISLQAPFNFNYEIKENIPISIFDLDNNSSTSLVLEELTKNSRYFVGSIPYSSNNELILSYGNGYLKNELTIKDGKVLSVNKDKRLEGVTVYPNPTEDKLHIKGFDSIEQVLIYNVVGKKMKYSLYGNILDITNLQKGIYFLKINNNKSFKIIKE